MGGCSARGKSTQGSLRRTGHPQRLWAGSGAGGCWGQTGAKLGQNWGQTGSLAGCAVKEVQGEGAAPRCGEAGDPGDPGDTSPRWQEGLCGAAPRGAPGGSPSLPSLRARRKQQEPAGKHPRAAMQTGREGPRSPPGPGRCQGRAKLWGCRGTPPPHCSQNLLVVLSGSVEGKRDGAGTPR